MINNRSRLALAAFGLSAALAVAAAPLSVGAQPAAPRQLPANPPPDRSPARNNQQYDRNDPRGYERRETRVDRRLDFLRTELRITAAQQRQWDDFANAVREEADQVRGGPGPGPGAGPGPDRRDDPRARNDGGRFAPPGVVERLERRQQNLMQRVERVDHLLATLRPLYASFSEDQRRTADELLFRPNRWRGDRLVMGDRFNRFMRPFDRRYGPFNRPY